jgi:hypothetical protein
VTGRSNFIRSAFSAVCLALTAWQAGGHAAQRDTRTVLDRLNPDNNAHRQDYAFLDGVGAVWPETLGRTAIPYDASSGFLVDRCHVLTTLHGVYPDDPGAQPALGKAVSFGVGQTATETSRGAARGLRFLIEGIVVAHGETTVIDREVQDPAADWALIQLKDHVDEGIPALPMLASTPESWAPGTVVTAAGFPADHRAFRADGFNFKDLWGSVGTVADVRATGTVGAIAETTIQATRGMSGSPVFTSVGGAAQVVIGMVQSIRGNGLDVSAQRPNVEVLFTPALLEEIKRAIKRTPCP